jgi:hypothetical protein
MNFLSSETKVGVGAVGGLSLFWQRLGLFLQMAEKWLDYSGESRFKTLKIKIKT